MGILLDAKKGFISLRTYYVEQVKQPHNNTIIQVISNKEEFDEWKSKGWKTEEEINRLKLADSSVQPTTVGAPVKKAEYDLTKVIKHVETHWKRLTWKEQNVIYSRCIKQVPVGDGKTMAELDNIKFKELKLKTCLKRWNVVDDSGTPVELTDDAIDSLDPGMAWAMLNDFEKVTEANAEDLKN